MHHFIEQYRFKITLLCRQFGVRRLDLFGSAAGDTFDPQRSDVDFIVEFNQVPGLRPAKQYFGLLHALEDLLGRPVDLVVASTMTNPFFMQQVERTKLLLHMT
jgi:uncharacterized protein